MTQGLRLGLELQLQLGSGLELGLGSGLGEFSIFQGSTPPVRFCV